MDYILNSLLITVINVKIAAGLLVPFFVISCLRDIGRFQIFKLEEYNFLTCIEQLFFILQIILRLREYNL